MNYPLTFKAAILDKIGFPLKLENITTKFIYTNSGEGVLINNNKNVKEINLPLFYYNNPRHSAGVKSVFVIDNNYFALISAKKISCLYAS